MHILFSSWGALLPGRISVIIPFVLIPFDFVIWPPLRFHFVCLVSTPINFFFVFIAEVDVSLLVLPLLIIRLGDATVPPNY